MRFADFASFFDDIVAGLNLIVVGSLNTSRVHRHSAPIEDVEAAKYDATAQRPIAKPLPRQPIVGISQLLVQATQPCFVSSFLLCPHGRFVNNTALISSIEAPPCLIASNIPNQGCRLPVAQKDVPIEGTEVMALTTVDDQINMEDWAVKEKYTSWSLGYSSSHFDPVSDEDSVPPVGWHLDVQEDAIVDPWVSEALDWSTISDWSTSPESTGESSFQLTCRGVPESEWGILDDQQSSTLVEEEPEFENPLDDFADAGCLEGYTLASSKSIARGRWGTVWLVQGCSGPKSAIKIVKISESDDFEERRYDKELALNEAHRLEYFSQMYDARSPWIVEFYGFALDPHETKLLLHMKYFPNGSLNDLEDEHGRSLNPQLAIFYTAELILALKFLHGHGVFHRDVKPRNILLTHDRHIRVADFGLSYAWDFRSASFNEKDYSTFIRMRDSDDPAFPPLLPCTENPCVIEGSNYSDVGTWFFAPPEVWNRQSYSFGTDYFGMGITLYEMLTGKLPYPTEQLENPDDVEAKDLEIVIDSDCVLNKHQRDFLEKVLNMDPAKRPDVPTMKAHPIFAHEGFDWKSFRYEGMEPPSPTGDGAFPWKFRPSDF